jgi:hypothetical protein
MQRVLRGMILLLVTCGTANAALISRLSGAAYYDDVLDITWLADANYAQTSGYDADGLMTWSQAQTWIGTLNTANYLGVNDWRLPTTLQPDPSCGSQYDPGIPYPLQGYGYGCTGSEMGHLFTVDGITSSTPSPFTNVQPYDYWSGTTYAPDTSGAWYFDFSLGGQDVYNKSLSFYAWAVRPGDIDPVPVPAAAWLLGSALGVMGVLRRKIVTGAGA